MRSGWMRVVKTVVRAGIEGTAVEKDLIGPNFSLIP